MALADTPYAGGVRELLDMLDEKTLESLAITATTHRILPDGRKEATNLILQYTDSLSRMFSYKRITSQILFNYLHKKGIPICSRASKNELIERVREKLEKSAVENNSIERRPISADEPFADNSDTSHNTTEAQDIAFKELPTAGPPQPLPPSSPHSMNLSIASSTPNTAMNIHLDTAAASVNVEVQQMEGGIAGGGEEMSEEFAREFFKWFYGKVNRLQPEALNLQEDTLTADMFVVNSSVEMYLYTGETKVLERHAVGQQDSFTTLRDTLLACRVIFCPNTDSGIWGEMSRFGMVRLQCCGTLHRDGALVGIFEQEFGLVKCPGGWRVMVLKVNLKMS